MPLGRRRRRRASRQGGQQGAATATIADHRINGRERVRRRASLSFVRVEVDEIESKKGEEGWRGAAAFVAVSGGRTAGGRRAFSAAGRAGQRREESRGDGRFSSSLF